MLQVEDDGEGWRRETTHSPDFWWFARVRKPGDSITATSLAIRVRLRWTRQVQWKIIIVCVFATVYFRSARSHVLCLDAGAEVLHVFHFLLDVLLDLDLDALLGR